MHTGCAPQIVGMNAITKLFACVLLAVGCCTYTRAQDTAVKTLRVAVLAPLYIDSAFNGTAYKLGTGNLPRYMLPGLEFYNGVMLAADSLQKEHAALQVWVYDTKKNGQPINTLIAGLEYMNFSLIIASLTNPVEQKLLSDFSFKKNIPVISATYPNDAGLSSNPFFIMLNSSLRTHVEGLYNYVKRNYPVGKILYLTKKGLIEDRILAQFSAATAPGTRLKYTVTQLNDNFTADELLPLLDSTRQNIIVCGTLNENFGTNLLNTLCAATSYRTTAIGMPTWDGLKAVNNSSCQQVEIVYSTPYNYSRKNAFGASLVKQYRARYAGRPSDMVFKGFESMYHFSKLLLMHRNDFINHVSDTSYTIANAFSFEPARLTNASFVPDYLENKKLYFVKMQAGSVKSIN